MEKVDLTLVERLDHLESELQAHISMMKRMKELAPHLSLLVDLFLSKLREHIK